MEVQEPCDVTVHYRDGSSEVHRHVTGDRVRELEELAFTDSNVVHTEASTAARPHPEFIDFHRELDQLVELVRSAADFERTGKPLAALGLAAHARARLAAELPAMVGSARLTGASWERIAGELGESKQTTHNRFAAFDPTIRKGEAA